MAILMEESLHLVERKKRRLAINRLAEVTYVYDNWTDFDTVDNLLVHEISHPCTTTFSATWEVVSQDVSFYMGESRDADDLLYQMQKCRSKGERKQRERRMGALLHLQYTSAGLRAPAAAFERFLVRNMIFGTESGKIPTGFALDRRNLWKYSVSGDNPIVLATFRDGGEEELDRLYTLIGLDLHVLSL